jgi:hypothetical protein
MDSLNMQQLTERSAPKMEIISLAHSNIGAPETALSSVESGPAESTMRSNPKTKLIEMREPLGTINEGKPKHEHSNEQNGWLASSIRAVTGLATRATFKTLEAASPYLSVAAQTAYDTAKSESTVVQRIGQASAKASDQAKDLRTLGSDLIASAERTSKHLAVFKANRDASRSASNALRQSSYGLLKKMVMQGATATACIAGLRALQQLIAHGSTGIISALPLTNIPLITVALAGSTLALYSKESAAFFNAARELTGTFMAGSTAGADAATELAESAISTQRMVGQILQHMPSGELSMLAN